jgi:hypothetical protein
MKPADYMVSLVCFVSVGLFLVTLNWRLLGIAVVVYLSTRIFRKHIRSYLSE